MPPKGWKKGVATLGPPPPGAVEAYNAGLLSGRWLKEDATPLYHQPAPVTAEQMRDAGIAFIGAPCRKEHHTAEQDGSGDKHEIEGPGHGTPPWLMSFAIAVATVEAVWSKVSWMWSALVSMMTPFSIRYWTAQ